MLSAHEVHADPVNFGGVYVDEDGALVIQYVGANAGRATVEELLASGVAVRWEKVERSQVDLMRILREVRDRHVEGVFMVSIDTIENQVKVGFDPDASVGDLAQTLANEYGDAVAAEPDTPMVVLPVYPSPSP